MNYNYYMLAHEDDYWERVRERLEYTPEEGDRTYCFSVPFDLGEEYWPEEEEFELKADSLEQAWACLREELEWADFLGYSPEQCMFDKIKLKWGP